MTPDPRAVYAENWAAEQEGTPRPSPLRALALTAVQLDTAITDDTQLGAALRVAITTHLDAQ